MEQVAKNPTKLYTLASWDKKSEKDDSTKSKLAKKAFLFPKNFSPIL